MDGIEKLREQNPDRELGFRAQERAHQESIECLRMQKEAMRKEVVQAIAKKTDDAEAKAIAYITACVDYARSFCYEDTVILSAEKDARQYVLDMRLAFGDLT